MGVWLQNGMLGRSEQAIVLVARVGHVLVRTVAAGVAVLDESGCGQKPVCGAGRGCHGMRSEHGARKQELQHCRLMYLSRSPLRALRSID